MMKKAEMAPGARATESRMLRKVKSNRLTHGEASFCGPNPAKCRMQNRGLLPSTTEHCERRLAAYPLRSNSPGQQRVPATFMPIICQGEFGIRHARCFSGPRWLGLMLSEVHTTSIYLSSLKHSWLRA
jgi:hypothetical protein